MNKRYKGNSKIRTELEYSELLQSDFSCLLLIHIPHRIEYFKVFFDVNWFSLSMLLQ